MNNCNDDPLIEAAAYLDNLHGDRNEADYDLTAQRVEKEPIAQNVVATAEKVIKALDECNKSDQRKKDVAMAVQAYKQQNKM